MKHTEIKQWKQTQEVLRDRIKGICIIVLVMLLCIGCQNDEKEENISDLNAEKVEESQEESENMISKVSAILGCDEETAKGVLEIIEENIDGNVKDIIEGESKVKKRLLVTNSEDTQYVVLVGRGYFVSEIYRDSEKGERIYFAIQ